MAKQSKPGEYIEVPVTEDWTLRTFAKNGTSFPVWAKDEILESFKEFAARKDDVWICGYPKAGTHWIWEIVTMLLGNQSELVTEVKEFSFAEAVGAKRLDEQPSPRVLNTHFPVRWMPADVWQKQDKIIFLMRNPKDTLVSYYFFVKNMTAKMCSASLQDYYRSNFICYDGWYKFNSDWLKKQKTCSNILILRYEDMHKDHLGTIQATANFLGISGSESFYQAVQEKTTFDYMQNNKANFIPSFTGNYNVYRKGKVGDWKNHFTVALNEEFDKEHKQKMKEFDLLLEEYK